MKLSIDSQAPDFSASNQDGVVKKLSDFKGTWLVLYFYPKDFTPGCTVEAQTFRDAYDALKQQAVIVGVSTDSVESHKKFCTHYTLPFMLLADPQKTLMNAYGTDGILFAKRTTFLIDPDGVIKKIYEKVDPQIHAQEIEKDLRTFRS